MPFPQTQRLRRCRSFETVPPPPPTCSNSVGHGLFVQRATPIAPHTHTHTHTHRDTLTQMYDVKKSCHTSESVMCNICIRHDAMSHTCHTRDNTRLSQSDGRRQNGLEALLQKSCHTCERVMYKMYTLACVTSHLHASHPTCHQVSQMENARIVSSSKPRKSHTHHTHI